MFHAVEPSPRKLSGCWVWNPRFLGQEISEQHSTFKEMRIDEKITLNGNKTKLYIAKTLRIAKKTSISFSGHDSPRSVWWCTSVAAAAAAAVIGFAFETPYCRYQPANGTHFSLSLSLSLSLSVAAVSYETPNLYHLLAEMPVLRQLSGHV